MERRGEEEELRRRKLEEALEVKSLRRILSAYLNYPEDAEEDIRRYESYFRKLPPTHKVLLSHLPNKFQNLRWCIAKNSNFIFEMLKAFEPPLDLSEEMVMSEDHYKDNEVNHPPKSETCNEEKQIDTLDENDGKCCTGSERNKKNGEAETAVANSSSNSNYSQVSSQRHCDEHVSLSLPELLDPSQQYHVPLVDVDKVRCIIRNIVRDWAAEGQKERDECYKPILEELKRLFPHRSKACPPTCLVPGAGLGRLALEISSLGFVSQGNEFSYYMMICSSFILNNCQVAEEWTIYPWIHGNCNSLSDNDQLRPVAVPDIHPASVGITEGFSMCGGDFVEVYNDPTQTGAWDVVVTCFFIDTAHNIVEYIEIISKILKDGGVWINFGPLLYHFADTYSQEDDMSIELSLEDVKRVACQYGFEIKKESMVETTYTTNSRSMMQNRYNAAFWTMRKLPVEARRQMPTTAIC